MNFLGGIWNYGYMSHYCRRLLASIQNFLLPQTLKSMSKKTPLFVRVCQKSIFEADFSRQKKRTQSFERQKVQSGVWDAAINSQQNTHKLYIASKQLPTFFSGGSLQWLSLGDGQRASVADLQWGFLH